jgi:hypothetical protein
MSRLNLTQYLAITAICICVTERALAQQLPEPGGDAISAQMAEFHPDEFAWTLFLFMNHPAKQGVAGIADPMKNIGGDEGTVVWETWALESGSRQNDAVSHSEVYKSDGSKPQDWDTLPRSTRTLELDQNLERLLVLGGTSRPTAKFDLKSPDNQEVRANKAMFEFIVAKGIYNLDGLEKIYSQAVTNNDRRYLQFSQGSKEIKAQWNPIPDSQKGRYLWRNAVGPDGVTRAYGLVSLHIITKDLTNWFWADFGHIDCETQTGACDNQWLSQVMGLNFVPQEPALTPLNDSTTLDTKGVRKETMGTFWENYRLRGTVTNFVDPIGQPAILSNPVIENGFQQSSCISCHARAAVGSPIIVGGKPSVRPNILSPGDAQVGTPNETLFGAGPGLLRPSIQFLQTDFIWSAPFRVHRCTLSGGCGN